MPPETVHSSDPLLHAAAVVVVVVWEKENISDPQMGMVGFKGMTGEGFNELLHIEWIGQRQCFWELQSGEINALLPRN